MFRSVPPLRMAACLLVAGAASGQDAVVPGEVLVDATFEHLGVVWEIAGDDDGDSAFVLEFRRTGDPTWSPGAPAMRSRAELPVDGAPLGLEHWAASAMFLEPGASYDLRLTLTDPDGGGAVHETTGTTRVPMAPGSGPTLHVVPGDGGGDGSVGDPFRGLQAAADAATPGVTFLVAPGLYAPFQLSASGAPGEPISFVAPDPAVGEAVVDGDGTTIGVVTIGTYSSTPVAHVIVEGLTIRDGRWGVDLQHTSDVTVRHCTIVDVDFGILNRRDADQERRQTVCDNVVEGRTAWPGAGIPGERGIDLRGHGNVVCHNRVRDFGDCISVQPFTGPSRGNDVFGNDVTRCVDDGIEIDYNEANVRVWRNRVANTRMGISVQPIRGGPAYLLRNELLHHEDKPLKLHNHPAGLVVAHNTGVKLGNALHDTSSSIWRNAILRNNLFLGTAYAFEIVTTATDGFRDLDFNAWGTTRAGTAGDPWFKWEGVRYDDLDDLRAGTGLETNGVAAAFADLVAASLPPTWDVEVDPDSLDLRLAAGAPEIDAGAGLGNLDSAFAKVGAPDLGALEHGLPRPLYGPRPRTAIFSDGFESGDTSAWASRR